MNPIHSPASGFPEVPRAVSSACGRRSRVLPAATVFPWLLLVAAGVLSVWMFWQAREGAGPDVGPGPGAGFCPEVLTSRFVRLFGIPVSLFGAVLYFSAVLASAFDTGRWRLDPRRPLAWTLLFAAVWFGFLQMFVLRDFCLVCAVIHLLTSVAGVMLLRSGSCDPFSSAEGVSVLPLVEWSGPAPETRGMVPAGHSSRFPGGVPEVLLRHGEVAVARVERMRKTSLSVNRQPQYRIDLVGEDGLRLTRRTHDAREITLAAEKLESGGPLTILHDPMKPGRLILLESW